MKVISARRAFAVFCWLIVVSTFVMSSSSVVAAVVAASWMIIEPALGQTGLQARSVDGATLLCHVGREVFTTYMPSPKGPVFMRLIEKTFGKNITTRTWDTVRKCADA